VLLLALFLVLSFVLLLELKLIAAIDIVAVSIVVKEDRAVCESRIFFQSTLVECEAELVFKDAVSTRFENGKLGSGQSGVVVIVTAQATVESKEVVPVLRMACGERICVFE
jgi:hypothetical protein